MVKKVFQTCWDLVNFSRRLIVNFLFLLIIIALIVAISSDDGKVQVADSSALVLNLNGALTEQLKYVDPVEAALSDSMGDSNQVAEILVDDVVSVIEHAKKDPKIKVIVLDLQKMHNAHLNKLKTVANALQAFKAEGKEIIAYGDFYSQSQYYLAAHADQILLNPYGAVGIEGYAVYPVYYKEALDKLKINQHVFRVGTYKSAVEPFTRNNMSEEAKDANKAWLNGLWDIYKADIMAQRKIAEDNFDPKLESLIKKFTEVDGDSGQFALQNKWVDALQTKDQLRQDLINKVGIDTSGKSFNRVSFKEYLTLIKPPFPVVNPLTEKVAVVVARGVILDGHQKAGTIGGDSTAELLRRARQNDQVKAVVLRVDSGGGSMFASEVIRQEVIALKEAGKPVIASMGSVAASGGYWISSAANEIWAAPSTITGSIGIFGRFFTFENSLAELGVHSDGVATTEYAGLSVIRELDPKFAQLIQLFIENGYDKFISIVSEARGLSKEEVDQIAQGRVWIGEKALQLGLVDKLGNKQQAIEAAAKMAGLEFYDVMNIEQELSPRDQFIKELVENAAVQSIVANSETKDFVKKGLVQQIQNQAKQIYNDVSQVKQYNDPNGAYVRCLECEAIN